MAVDRPRTVLMTADSVGGVWHYALELAAALGTRGVRVALATMGAPLTPSQREQLAKLPSLTVFESSYALEWMEGAWEDVWRAGRWLLSLQARLAPDVVHLNQSAFGSLPFAAPKLVVAHSCVLSWWQAVHGTAAPPMWSRYRETVAEGLARASLVAAPTRGMLATLDNNYGYRGEGVAIANGRNAASFKPGAKDPVILAAGRLWDAAKNLVALEAVAPHLPWPVVVAGATAHPDGGVRPARCVLALGELAPETLARHYARASIYALPARYEPFGLSILEAGLAGCALVLGDVPSLREVWRDAALYVPPDDHIALRECLSKLIADEALRTRLATKARARALAYTPQRMARGYLAAYTRILRAARAPRGISLPEQPESRACVS